MNSIFICPCIVIYSYSTTNKMNLLSQIIYSCKTLYIFRTAFPSIIRSLKLRIQQRYMSNSCCYQLLSGMRWNGVHLGGCTVGISHWMYLLSAMLIPPPGLEFYYQWLDTKISVENIANEMKIHAPPTTQTTFRKYNFLWTKSQRVFPVKMVGDLSATCIYRTSQILRCFITFQINP